MKAFISPVIPEDTPEETEVGAVWSIDGANFDHLDIDLDRPIRLDPDAHLDRSDQWPKSI
jgi:hypothetical protein